MNDLPAGKRPRGTRWCSIGIWAAVIGVLAVILSLGSARLDLFGAQQTFLIFAIALLAFVVSLISTLVGLAISRGTAGAASAQRAWFAMGSAVLFFIISFSLAPSFSGNAPINDITTDVGNPPQFSEAMKARRADADPGNSIEYPGPETAKQQQSAYPDIQTLSIEKPTEEVFGAAELLVKELGWEIVTSNPDNGTIEATDTTFWFRFKDDVVVQLTPRGYGTYVNVRSKSRVGRGDMGTNANRIRTFLARLEESTGA